MAELKARLDSLQVELGQRLEQSLANRAQELSTYVDTGTQLLLAIQFRNEAANGRLYPLHAVEFRNHSQTGEDGILLYVFSLIGTTNRRVVEMCAGTGRECNSANLILNHGWTGLLCDGNLDNVETARHFFSHHPNVFLAPFPTIVHTWITAENVDQIIEQNGFAGEIDLFSLDMDGIDLWVWEALTAISPRVVILEIQAIWMAEESLSVPYKPNFSATWTTASGESSPVQYGGASLLAFIKIGRKKGYRLIGGNRLNHNVVFLRDDVGRDTFPEINGTSIFSNPHVKKARETTRHKLLEHPWEEI